MLEGLMCLHERDPEACAIALYSSIRIDFTALSEWQTTMIKMLGEMLESEHEAYQPRSDCEVTLIASIAFRYSTFGQKPNLRDGEEFFMTSKAQWEGCLRDEAVRRAFDPLRDDRLRLTNNDDHIKLGDERLRFNNTEVPLSLLGQTARIDPH